jgi:hypothetical protein
MRGRQIDLDEVRYEVELLVHSKVPWAQIKTSLYDIHGIDVSMRTLRRKSMQWGLHARTSLLKEGPVVQYIIQRFKTSKDGDEKVQEQLCELGFQVLFSYERKYFRVLILLTPKSDINTEYCENPQSEWLF